MTAPRRWLLCIDTLGRPPTTNAKRRQHFHTQARVTAAWREAGAWAAMIAHIPPLEAITVKVWGRYPDRRSLPDLAGVEPGVKAVVDGLVDARVVPDDRAQYVRSISFSPPVVEAGMFPALMVEVIECPT